MMKTRFRVIETAKYCRWGLRKRVGHERRLLCSSFLWAIFCFTSVAWHLFFECNNISNISVCQVFFLQSARLRAVSLCCSHFPGGLLQEERGGNSKLTSTLYAFASENLDFVHRTYFLVLYSILVAPLFLAVSHGSFLCIKCAGVHRSLGVHIRWVLFVVPCACLSVY